MPGVILNPHSKLFVFLLLIVGIKIDAAVIPNRTVPHANFGEIKHKLGSARINWIENLGQEHKDVAFYARTFAGTTFVTHKLEIVYSFPIDSVNCFELHELFVNARQQTPKAENPSGAKMNYFTGGHPSAWKSNIPSYESLCLGELWSGVNVTLNAFGNNTEKLFEVQPGAEPANILMHLPEASRLRISKKGELLVGTAKGCIRFTKPIAWQVIHGSRILVRVGYNLVTKNKYGFTLGDYDTSFPLYIDPLIASTFIGGSNNELGLSIATDATGNVFVSGYTRSSNYPTAGNPYYGSLKGGVFDVFVSKFSNDLSMLMASTYIGGTKDDYANAIGIDLAGNVFITGYTESGGNYPVAGTPYDNSSSIGYDAFVSKLSNDLSVLLVSTFVGGNKSDVANALTIDSSGNIFITGYTSSSDYPVSGSSYDPSMNGGSDVFVSKLNNNLSLLLASTLIGGNNSDQGTSIIQNSVGDILIAGTTSSADYPVSASAYDASYNGGEDIFISRLSGDLSSLLASTYLGGASDDRGNHLCIDPLGNALVAGETKSWDFPVSANAFGRHLGRLSNVYVSKLNSNLSSLLASTCIGLDSVENGGGIASDSSGVIIYGFTTLYDNLHSHFPGTQFYGSGKQWGMFLYKLNNDLSFMISSIVLEANDFGYGNSIIQDVSGNIFTTGYTQAWNFPTTTDCYDSSYSGGYDAFICKFRLGSKLLFLPSQNISYCYDSALLQTGNTGDAYRWNNGNTTKALYVQDTGWFTCATYKNDTVWMDSIHVFQELPTIHYFIDTICQGNDILLIASDTNSGTYIWNTGETTKQVNVTSQGWHILVMKGSATCPAYDSFYVMVSSPEPVFSGRDTSLCSGDSILLDATSNHYNSYLWNTGVTGPLLFVRNPGTYWVRAYDNYCSVYDTVILKIETKTPLNFPKDTFFCSGSLISISAKVGQYNTWLWNTGDHTSEINVTIPGLFRVTATDGICTASDSINIIEVAVPQLHLPRNISVCFDELKAILLDAGSWKTYTWYPTGEHTQTISATTPEIYIVVVTDTNNCPGSDTAFVEEECPYGIYVPDAFTPNSDGLNDMFIIKGYGIAEINLKIFDRRNEMVFSSADIGKSWDGRFKGEPCAIDIYTYTLEYGFKKDLHIQTMRGNITLLR